MKSARMPHEFLAIEKEHARRALRMYGPIAQSVEQLAFNQWVAGSSPARLKPISGESESLIHSPLKSHNST